MFVLNFGLALTYACPPQFVSGTQLFNYCRDSANATAAGIESMRSDKDIRTVSGFFHIEAIEFALWAFNSTEAIDWLSVMLFLISSTRVFSTSQPAGKLAL